MDKKLIEKAFRTAIEEAKEGIAAGHGGPFGALVIKDGQVIARAHNTVLRDNDPTAHAEVNALRMACKELGTHELKGCVLVTTSEPCPMCLASSYWAKVKEIRYALGRQVAEEVGFRDIWIDEDIAKPVHERRLPLIHHPEFEEAKDNFSIWLKLNGESY